MEIIKKTKEMQDRCNRIRSNGKKIALVPTMGFFHEGHLSLMKEGKNRGDKLVVSIFVNPTQFGPEEDFEAYPRDMERDLKLARHEGVDLVFTPDAKELYKNRFQTYISLEKLPCHLCGISRPVHFKGVATVVAKLFNIVKPGVAIFGQKDYQQLAVIRQMADDLNFDIEIVGGATLREPDGLAMSSRNTYLTHVQRSSAIALYKSLINAQEMVKNGMENASEIIQNTSDIINSYPETKIEYIEICDIHTLEKIEAIAGTALMALAVKVGKTRLIDNMILNP